MNFLTNQKLTKFPGSEPQGTLKAKKTSYLKYLYILFFLFSAYSATAQTANTVTIEGTNLSFQKAFASITKQTGYVFFYNVKIFENAKTVNLNIQKKSVIDALNILFEGQPFSYSIQDRTIVVASTAKENKGTGSIEVHGSVINSKGEPFPGVNVWVTGTRVGAITDFDGSFVLHNAPANGKIEVSGLTIETSKLDIDGRSNLIITAKEKVSVMSEIVVNNGYQKISKNRSTGSVSVITSKDLEKIPVSNVMHQLEGQVAGLAIDIEDSDNSFVYSNLFGSNQGNGSYNFRIRGQSTYSANSMPLIILDGTPTELDIRTINPKDIEKITFLKDAAAASIYGARSANGVMVIETKKGRKGKTRFSASQNYAIANKASLSSLPLMNSSQVLNLEQELVDKGVIADPAAAAGSLYYSTPISQGVEYMFQEKRGTITTVQKNEQLDILRGRNNYDQVTQYLMRPSESNTYDFSFSGGENDYSYFTSASFSNEKTQAIGTGGKRMTFTVNQDFKLLNYLKVSTSLKGSFFNFSQNGIGLTPLASSLTTYLPYNEIVDNAGNSVSYDRRFYSADTQRLQSQGYLPWTYNYIDELNNADTNLKEQNYSANISVTAPLLKGLDAVATYYIEKSNLDNNKFSNANTYFARDMVNLYTYLDPSTNELVHGVPLGGINQSSRFGKDSYTGRGQLVYNTLLANKHSIDVLGGIEFRETKESNQTGTLYGYNETSQTSIDLPSSTPNTIYGYATGVSYNNSLKSQTRRFLSYYGNASYTYDNKYTLSGSARLDDYNNFGVDKSYRRTPLWSTGFKWNITKENFMKNATLFDNLSFRASYGYNGNISLTTFPFTNISLADVDRYSQQPYAFVSAAANPALRWEKTGIMNFGLDFTMFDYRINGTIEYYKKNSKDLIQEFPVSPFYGVPNSMLVRNASTLEGHGIDFNLNAIIVRTKDFEFNLNLVTSYNTNEVTDSRFSNFTNILNGSGSTAPIVGYGTNSVFAFRNAGLNNAGSVQVYDKDGNIVQANTTLTNIEDMKYMGTSTPKYYGSLSANLTYKKLSLYLLATYKLDYVLFKPSFDMYVDRYGSFKGYDLNSEIDQRWRNPGDEATTNVPGVRGMSGYSYARYRFSDDRVIDGDHIRFKEVSLKYDLSELFANTFIDNASLTCSARNLGIIWRKNNDNIDPDFLPLTGSQMKLPPTAMYSMGFNFNF
ncbi:SusC/RagA family TonB-linked outer membrane protein [Flavobacterium sp. ANB]|uniref:SusC/RagA family TonB-linked outer membrane protein n=1 Tax=unclassified Flavobacterium TaxID=196869 RepID=UPI0012B8AD99|nr:MULTISPECIES: SusC/RagA family TonB-linked outer membrane protein [unclassified Flavobacterium]MBF4516858.1 SusC/RagA family TonB-linked outer membrane protein [Flavobacterium sp. ANB]MTD69246.1 SusC/RagA family TonB-linked outer membrane protein [Flavobacterium sp. LC2016-13]